MPLDQEGPAPPEDSAKSDSDLTLCFAIPGGRAPPAGVPNAVTTALGVLFAMGQEDPAAPADTASSVSVVVCSLRSQEAELQQQALRLLLRQGWHGPT